MAEDIEITSKLLSSMAPLRSDKSHKGTFGTVLVCAGSDYMSGALDIAVGAALRSGSGMVIAYSTDKALDVVRVNHPCAVLARREDTAAKALRQANELLKRCTSVLIGPGLEVEDQVSKALIEHFTVNAPRLVIDASALTIMAKDKEVFYPLLQGRDEPAILTPHIGEFRRLTGEDLTSPEEMASSSVQFALQNKCIAVLKNHKTLIALNSGKKYISNYGNSGLAKGGSGDFLSGLMAGFLSQGMSGEEAAVCAVGFHSAAGAIASEDLGKRAMLPTDLERYLPEAFCKAGW
ncbi:MAG: NAD(P)H-hydrate dehydratase [Saccharofermentans sp.]|nr:NAD(P)H-hydrate dehydratase [Saccharofermentans sp.]